MRLTTRIFLVCLLLITGNSVSGLPFEPVQSKRLPKANSSGDYEPSITQHSYWIVKEGPLNGRASATDFVEGSKIMSWPVVRTFDKGTVLMVLWSERNGSMSFKDSDGLLWFRVVTGDTDPKASYCYVRASARFLAPVKVIAVDL